MLRTTAIAALLSSPALAEPLTIVALGDMPYGDPAEVYPPFETLIETINEVDADLVVHIGDTKSGGTPCTDQMLDEQLAYLGDFQAPTLYTPGDNEWTDCHRESAGGFDPLGRLAYIRETYFAEPGTSFGAEAIEIESQGEDYPENARTMVGDVMVVTAHVVGSNNNFETRSMEAVEEYMARDEATVTWLNESFEAAGEAEAEAMIVAVHASMFDDTFDTGDAEWNRVSGFANFGEALKKQAAAFGKPVLLIYGDEHIYELAIPFPTEAPNLTALQVPGAEQMHAVEIRADPELPGAFAIELLRNPALGES